MRQWWRLWFVMCVMFVAASGFELSFQASSFFPSWSSRPASFVALSSPDSFSAASFSWTPPVAHSFYPSLSASSSLPDFAFSAQFLSSTDMVSDDAHETVVPVRVDMDMWGQTAERFEADAKQPLLATFADVADVESNKVHLVSMDAIPKGRRLESVEGVNVVVEVDVIASSLSTVVSAMHAAFESGTLVEALRAYGLDVVLVLNGITVEESNDDADNELEEEDETGRSTRKASPAVVIVATTATFAGAAFLVVVYFLKRRRTKVAFLKIGL